MRQLYKVLQAKDETMFQIAWNLRVLRNSKRTMNHSIKNLAVVILILTKQSKWLTTCLDKKRKNRLRQCLPIDKVFMRKGKLSGEMEIASVVAIIMKSSNRRLKKFKILYQRIKKRGKQNSRNKLLHLILVWTLRLSKVKN